MPKCRSCGVESPLISKSIGLCRDCVVQQDIQKLKDNHAKLREERGLSSGQGGTKRICNLCLNECAPPADSSSFCGLRKLAPDGTTESMVDENNALLHAYKDRLPTNCCSSWFCPRGTNPPAIGYNLAVFFYSCSFHCLFCQNYSHWNTESAKLMEIDSILDWIKRDKTISCVCYFGGTPEPHFPFALKLSERILAEVDREVQICFEWNGSGRQDLVKKAVDHVVASGGNIKFDLKAWDKKTHVALTGQSNRVTLANFSLVAELVAEYDGDYLTASTLLVPGYVSSHEVAGIAGFIASHGNNIPYSLLVFHPDYLMNDLPITPVQQARECMQAAENILDRVHLGNAALLGLPGYFET